MDDDQGYQPSKREYDNNEMSQTTFAAALDRGGPYRGNLAINLDPLRDNVVWMINE